MTIENCLFVGNVSNVGVDPVSRTGGKYGEYNDGRGAGALTVLANSVATVSNSTFVGNWNGVDDDGAKSVFRNNPIHSTYRNNIFWNNTLSGGISSGSRYEMDIFTGEGVIRNFIYGNERSKRKSYLSG